MRRRAAEAPSMKRPQGGRGGAAATSRLAQTLLPPHSTVPLRLVRFAPEEKSLLLATVPLARLSKKLGLLPYSVHSPNPRLSPLPSSPQSSPAMVTDKSNLPQQQQPPPSASSAPSSLKSLNKASYKISKQSSSASPAPVPASTMRAPSPPPPAPRPPPPLPQPPQASSVPADHPPPQPPVYNIDKSDFRDVVQKLTGSPSHLLPPQPAPTPATAPLMAPPPPPPPIMAPPTAIPSRLHRIRPPPLAPPPILPPAPPALSPLPPLPAVCMTAESPISAYMRRLRGMPSPIRAPTSPLGFGCLPSPGVPMPATSPRVRDP
ncbi:hypothetical protein Zm00014a_017933 [Zea mays]|uniref:VQ domain-containing protein n=2 Tax=Zea mays TaxID=4577 RepID=A0A3L6D9N6_MAIZE|nr:hypothetical protein Zm00014a_017933 [Zea mays]